MPLKELPEWDELMSYAKKHLTSTKITDVDLHAYHFQERQLKLTICQDGLTKKIWNSLLTIASKADIHNDITSLFEGHEVNKTEHKQALHTLLREPSAKTKKISQNIFNTSVKDTLNKMEELSRIIRKGQWKGATGKTIRHIVNIGIGGSYLGPKLLLDALKPYASKKINVEFVSNIDPCDIEETLKHTNLEETLFIISSKSFETDETLANTKIVIELYKPYSNAIEKHFFAITAHPEKAKAIGIPEENILTIWDWVGGRYSLWSAISCSVVIAIGMANFRRILAGGHSMDLHFLNAPLKDNLPIRLALLDIWNINFLGAESMAIIPYAKNLRYFVPFVSQLYMESLGKNHNQSGQPIDYNTGAIIWGDVGTNSQHSFHQLLFQGTHWVPCDFILPLQTHAKNKNQHEDLKKNCYAQIEVLKKGRRDNNPHHTVFGGKPYVLIELTKITPYVLGQLIALFEHRVFTQASIWGINPFDQFGVEQGKIFVRKK